MEGISSTTGSSISILDSISSESSNLISSKSFSLVLLPATKFAAAPPAAAPPATAAPPSWELVLVAALPIVVSVFAPTADKLSPSGILDIPPPPWGGMLGSPIAGSRSLLFFPPKPAMATAAKIGIPNIRGSHHHHFPLLAVATAPSVSTSVLVFGAIAPSPSASVTALGSALPSKSGFTSLPSWSGFTSPTPSKSGLFSPRPSRSASA